MLPEPAAPVEFTVTFAPAAIAVVSRLDTVIEPSLTAISFKVKLPVDETLKFPPDAEFSSTEGALPLKAKVTVPAALVVACTDGALTSSALPAVPMSPPEALCSVMVVAADNALLALIEPSAVDRFIV